MRSIPVLITKDPTEKLSNDKSRVLCYVELFWKEILLIKVIINSDCFSQNRSLKSAQQKAVS